MAIFKQRMHDLLQMADVRVNGDRPWDIQVHNENLYKRVLRQGSLGLGEAYMDEWWDAGALDQFFTHILSAHLQRKISTRSILLTYLRSTVLNPQAGRHAFEIGDRHYDTGNDLFRAMLDRRMVYTCGYWQNAKNLDEAQANKLNTICQKLELKTGMRVLDIGCGWGSFAKFAAKNYGVEVMGITVSREQMELARERCQDLPVEIHLQDYREIDQSFDRVVSLGMFEHVGYKNYRAYMKMVSRCLADGGIFVLNTIGSNHSVKKTDPWIEKYIFPNSMVPSVRQIGLAIEDLLIMKEWQNYGPFYDRTLMAWYENFKDSWQQLKANYSKRFYRMWEYYLMCSAASFRTQKNHLWQIVFTKGVAAPSLPTKEIYKRS